MSPQWVQGTLVRCLSWMYFSLSEMFFFSFFRLYSVVWRIVQYASCRLHLRDCTKRRTNLALLFCCRVHMCSMPRAWRHLKNSHWTKNQCVPCADHIITRNCCSGWKFFYSCTTVISTIFSTDDDCRECKPVRTDREIMLSSIWTRNIACYFFFTYLVDGRRNLPTLLGFWISNPSIPSSRWLYNLTFVGQNFISINWAFYMQCLWLNSQTCSFNTALDEVVCFLAEALSRKVKTCNISWVPV